ncbi:SDR family NAD(P)-dependent oxidoreductase [Georgenia sp. Z1344]|uniref:SDR family NAD(P)-dependent oxidoreductase n=1 Tax=Georgenia sp. Z1344 TaxID=3416706 RepID=UPI003CF844B7
MRTIVLTGASDGIGAAAAERLAGDSVRLVVVGRSPEKTRSVAGRVGAEHHVADFTRLDEVRDLAAELDGTLDRIDVLANNAGGFFAGPVRTEDGFEKTFQVNHLAPYLLTNLLREKLVASGASVVATASVANIVYARLDLDDIESLSDFRPDRAYGNAKLANILFTRGLHAALHRHGVSSVAFHPGVVATSFGGETSGLLRRMYHGALRPLLTRPARGGATLAHFVDGTPGTTWESGRYYNDRRRPGLLNRAAKDPATVRQHWEMSAQMLGVDWSLDTVDSPDDGAAPA